MCRTKSHILCNIYSSQLSTINCQLSTKKGIFAPEKECLLFRVLAKPRTKNKKDMKHKKEAALVCFSGGQDSTTCLFWPRSTFSRRSRMFYIRAKTFPRNRGCTKNCSRCRRPLPTVGRVVDQPARPELFADKHRHFNGSGKTGRQLPKHLRSGT